MRARRWSRFGALLMASGLLVSACSAAAPGSATPSGASADGTTLAMPLAPMDVEAFRAAEAALRRDSRDKAGLAKVGPAAEEFAGLMDRAASTLLATAAAKMKSAPKVKSATTAGGRLAAPRGDLGAPGAPVFGTFLVTSSTFNSMIETQTSDLNVHSDTPEKCPCTKEATFDPTTDEVTVQGNKGTIRTTMSVKGTFNGSKVSIDIKMKVEGEVRDAKSGALLYKISAEANGHADGDACPDTSGVVHANMSFGGTEDYFDSSGAKTGSGVSESFGGQIRVRADDNAKMSGVDYSPTGQGGKFMLEMAARGAAPAFENAWRSGMCIQVIASPAEEDVDPDAEVTVTVKVKHKIEGNDLDKPVEAKMSSGPKSIDPSGQKQKSPATFKYKAGPQSGDHGVVSFDSVSNRGIGGASGNYTVGGGWVISGTGTSNENFQSGVVANNLRVSIKDLKVKAEKDGALTGTGSMTLSGQVTAGGLCKGQLDQTLPITAKGTLVGSSSDGTLKLTLVTPAQPGVMVTMTCQLPGVAYDQAVSAEGYADRYGEALGQIELPAGGGTKTASKTTSFGGVMDVAASGTFTVVKAKK